MPPLLQRLSERKPETLDYLGVSFGLTKDLLRFWKKMGFMPLYASQKENALTGEYTFVMLKSLASGVAQSEEWLSSFAADFRARFMALLSYPSFAKFEAATALSILDATSRSSTSNANASGISSDELSAMLSPFDMKRLQSYTSGMLEHHVILDLVPALATLFFGRKLVAADCSLSAAQQAILLAMGLQRKNIDALERELGLGASQALALFGKVVRRLAKALEDIRKEGVGREIPDERDQVTVLDGQGQKKAPGAASTFEALQETVEQELKSSAKEVSEEQRRQREMQKEILGGLDMRQ